MATADYFDNIGRAMMTFQFLEVTLKFYIRDCDRLIQKAVKDSFHYSVREKEIEKMPLCKLIDEFARRSNRKDLVSALKTLLKHRNSLAHSSYILMEADHKEPERLKNLAIRLKKITDATNMCLKELVQEYSHVTKVPVAKELLDELTS